MMSNQLEQQHEIHTLEQAIIWLSIHNINVHFGVGHCWIEEWPVDGVSIEAEGGNLIEVTKIYRRKYIEWLQDCHSGIATKLRQATRTHPRRMWYAYREGQLIGASENLANLRRYGDECLCVTQYHTREAREKRYGFVWKNE